MIAIIVPAHNAQETIDACLESLVRAARHPALAEDEVQITVVLDRCDDRSGWLARSWGVHTIDVEAGNVGAARKAGADAAVRAGARWLAFADGDSVVAEDWLAAQIRQSTDVVCAAVLDGALDESNAMFHAANFGLSAKAYLAAEERRNAQALAHAQDLPIPVHTALAAATPVRGIGGGGGAKSVLQAAASRISMG